MYDETTARDRWDTEIPQAAILAIEQSPPNFILIVEFSILACFKGAYHQDPLEAIFAIFCRSSFNFV